MLIKFERLLRWDRFRWRGITLTKGVANMAKCPSSNKEYVFNGDDLVELL